MPRLRSCIVIVAVVIRRSRDSVSSSNFISPWQEYGQKHSGSYPRGRGLLADRPLYPLSKRRRRGYIAGMSGVLVALLVIAMLATLGVLFAGMLTMARGGEFNRTYGNKFMRARVILQGIALLLFALLVLRSEEHTSELPSLMRISYAVFCLK